MCGIPRSPRASRRRFLALVSGTAAGVLLAACGPGGEPPTHAPAAPTTTVPPPLPTPTAGGVSTAGVPTPLAASPSAPLAGLDAPLPVPPHGQRVLLSPLDPAWSYSRGPWARLPHPGWPTDRMAAVMSDAWVRGDRVLKGGVGRRCAIAIDSPFATLVVEGDGRSFSFSLNGGTPLRIGPLARDGSRVEVPLFQGRTGTTRIELIFDEGGTNDGLYIAPPPVCKDGLLVDPNFGVWIGGFCPAAPPIPGAKAPRLVVLGNGYAAGTGASAPGTTACAALLGEGLGMEAIAQGWERTDVDVRSGEPGDPPDSGLDRVATDVIALKPDAILLIYGLQAAAAARASWEYSYHYAQMLRAIRTALPGAPIFCSGFPPCNEDQSAAFVQEWNGAVRSAANTVDNCPYIEAAGWWGPANYAGGAGPVYVGGDRVHPNDAGHRFLAAKYATAIAAYMR